MEEAGPIIVIVTLLILLIFLKVGLIGMAIVIEVFNPQYTERVYQTYRDQSTRCVIMGLVNLVAGVIVAGILAEIPALSLFGIALFIAIIAGLVIGYTAVYRGVGERLTLGKSDESFSREMLWGGVTAEAAFLAPILGQSLSVWLTLRGFGAVVLTLLARKSKEAAPIETE